MIKIYESFAEFANDFVDGENLSHMGSKHSADECFGWQKGVREFAAWLDNAGGKLLCDPGVYEKLWDSWAEEQKADRKHPESV